MSKPSTFQIHHIIPVEAFNNRQTSEKLKELFGADQLQSFNNRLPMFDEQYKDSAPGFEQFKEHYSKDFPELKDFEFGGTYHQGGHGTYNAAVIDKLTDIFDSPSSNEAKKIAVIDLQATLRQLLVEGKISLYQKDSKDIKIQDQIRSEIEKNTLDPTTIDHDFENKTGEYERIQREVAHYDQMNEKYPILDPIGPGAKLQGNNQQFTKDLISRLFPVIYKMSQDKNEAAKLSEGQKVILDKIYKESTQSSTGEKETINKDHVASSTDKPILESTKKYAIAQAIAAFQYANGFQDKIPSSETPLRPNDTRSKVAKKPLRLHMRKPYLIIRLALPHKKVMSIHKFS